MAKMIPDENGTQLRFNFYSCLSWRWRYRRRRSSSSTEHIVSFSADWGVLCKREVRANTLKNREAKCDTKFDEDKNMKIKLINRISLA